MIDLNQIGYNVIQTDPNTTSDGSLEITGGLTLTVKIRVASPELAPDPQAILLHVKKRIREKIWDMAYGHLKEPIQKVRDELYASPRMGSLDMKLTDVELAFHKLEKAIGEP